VTAKIEGTHRLHCVRDDGRNQDPTMLFTQDEYFFTLNNDVVLSDDLRLDDGSSYGSQEITSPTVFEEKKSLRFIFKDTEKISIELIRGTHVFSIDRKTLEGLDVAVKTKDVVKHSCRIVSKGEFQASMNDYREFLYRKLDELLASMKKKSILD
jgi:hypothetical protein